MFHQQDEMVSSYLFSFREASYPLFWISEFCLHSYLAPLKCQQNLVSITVLSYRFYPLLFADEWKVELLKKVENNYPHRLHVGGCFRFGDLKTICLIPPPFMRKLVETCTR